MQLQPLELSTVQEANKAEDKVSDKQASVKGAIQAADAALKSSRMTMKTLKLDGSQIQEQSKS